VGLTEQTVRRHMVLMGQTGSGKSTLMRRVLRQIAMAGDIAVILDPAGEYYAEFWNPARGDWNIDPTSGDCPYWAFEREAPDEAHGLAWGKAFFPGQAREQPFFLDWGRQMFGFLMSRYNEENAPKQPIAQDQTVTCANFAQWLANPLLEIMPRFARSEFATAASPLAKDQQAGLFGQLAKIASIFRMMPASKQDRSVFSVREYCADRLAGKQPGWIFLTSTKMTAEAVKRIHTAIIDTLILGNQARPTTWRKPRHIYFFLDELPTSLDRVPQLMLGITNLRRSGGTVILGIHDMAQMEEKYGEKGAVTVMNQANITIGFGQGDASAAKYLEMKAGHREILRMVETRPLDWWGQRRARSWSTQIVTEPVIMAAEIQGLPPFHGFVIHRGMILPITTDEMPEVIVHKRRERLIPPFVPEMPSIESEENAIPVWEDEDLVPVWVGEEEPKEARRRGRPAKVQGVNLFEGDK
jgi:hypothetical protein